ncbi:hypothetical protein J9303_09265 [Bacillaceae bacterium Marseille-Q3522]|nr:hypothetical protein [Bacillaceae bacterium Marseille-Q3522]
MYHNKIIIPFVEKHIFEFYNEHLSSSIKRKIAEYVSTYDREPDYTFEIVKQFLTEQKTSGTELYSRVEAMRVDEFIWAFIYDVYHNTNWTYQATLAETDKTCEFVTASLSQVLKSLAPYYPLKEQINESLYMAQRLMKFKRSIPQFLQCIEKGKLNIKLRLTTLSNFLLGGEIKHNASPFSRTVATVSNCIALTLYKREKDHLALVDFCGNVTPAKTYMLHDTDSFIVYTYKSNNDEVEYIYYSDKKQLIYLTKKLNEFILSAHFNLSEHWTETRVKGYENQIHTAIM